jgi:hypothetical protein
MPVQQITLNFDNGPGEFADLLDLLGENDISVVAVSLANAGDDGIVRFVVSDPEKAMAVFRSHGYPCESSRVIAVETPNHPGGINAIFRSLKASHIKVNCLYSCLTRGGRSILIIEVEKANKATSALRKNWMHLVDKTFDSL